MKIECAPNIFFCFYFKTKKKSQKKILGQVKTHNYKLF